MINLQTFVATRVVMHTILPKGRDEKHSAVEYDLTLIELVPDVEEILRKRLISAAGKDSKVFELEFGDIGQGSIYDLTMGLLSKSNDEYLKISRLIADKLAFSQKKLGIPGGYLLIIEGTYDLDLPITIIIKAEPHEALTIIRTSGQSKLELLKDIFLSPSQKFYKIGMIYRREEILHGDDILPPNDETACLLFDEQFRADGKPAEYFYRDFLGFSTEKNPKIQTFNFYTKTEEFVQNEVTDIDTKSSILSSLKHKLRDSTAEVIKPKDFAIEYFGSDTLIDKYAVNVLTELPGSIIKNNSLIKNKILNKRIGFSSQINIAGPDEGFDDKVEFVMTEDEMSNLDPNDSGYTIVKIIGRPYEG